VFPFIKGVEVIRFEGKGIVKTVDGFGVIPFGFVNVG